MRSLIKNIFLSSNLSFTRICSVRFASSKSDAQKSEEELKNVEEIKKSKFLSIYPLTLIITSNLFFFKVFKCGKKLG